MMDNGLEDIEEASLTPAQIELQSETAGAKTNGGRSDSSSTATRTKSAASDSVEDSLRPVIACWSELIFIPFIHFRSLGTTSLRASFLLVVLSFALVE